jgi:hypothetical protein
MRFAWLLLFAGPAFAAPPTLTAPAEVAGEIFSYIEIKPETNAKWVRFRAIDPGLRVFPTHRLEDKGVAIVDAMKPGRYRLWAYAGNDDGGADAVIVVVIGGAKPEPDPVKPPPVDPPAGKVYFLIVRPNGPASADFVRVMDDPAWSDHRKAGRVVKDMTVTESARFYTPPPGTTLALPYVVTLRVGATESSLISGPSPLPTTADAIRRLGENLK